VGREVIGVTGIDECNVEFGKTTGSLDYLVITYKGMISTPEEIEKWFKDFPCPVSFEDRLVNNLGQAARFCASTAENETVTNTRVTHLLVRQGSRSIWIRASQKRQSAGPFERIDLETTLRVMARQVLDAG
jgi:hypothetical protein